jgi:hypothetical protein
MHKVTWYIFDDVEVGPGSVTPLAVMAREDFFSSAVDLLCALYLPRPSTVEASGH